MSDDEPHDSVQDAIIAGERDLDLIAKTAKYPATRKELNEIKRRMRDIAARADDPEGVIDGIHILREASGSIAVPETAKCVEDTLDAYLNHVARIEID